MAGWKCARCSTVNDESGISCTNCGLMRGSVVIGGTSDGPIGTESIPIQRPAPEARPAAETPWTPDAPRAMDAPPATPATGGSPVPDSGAPAEVPSWMVPNPELAGPEAPPARVPIWKRLPLGNLLFVALLIGGGITTWYFGAGRNEAGQIAKPGDLGAVDLRVGDCYDLKEPQASEIEDVAAKPCTEAHEYELFFVGSLPEGAYPADAVFERYVLDNCDPAFATYVGTAYQDSTLDIYWLIPTPDSWDSGDRSVQCAVYDPKIPRLTTSLKGASR